MSGVSAIVHVIDFLCFDTPMVCATIIIIIIIIIIFSPPAQSL